MFCKSCGKEISNTAEFCPFCGNKVEGKLQSSVQNFGIPLNFQAPMSSTVASSQGKKKKGINLDASKKKILLFSGIAVFAIGLIIGIILLIFSKNVEYSVVGEWKSNDLVNLPDIISDFAEEEGYRGEVVEFIMKQLELDNIGENLSLIFTEDNKILVVFGEVSLGSNLFTYEEMANDKMLIQLDVDVYDIPFSVGHVGEYEVGKDSLALDFFGYDIEFTRR